MAVPRFDQDHDGFIDVMRHAIAGERIFLQSPGNVAAVRAECVFPLVFNTSFLLEGAAASHRFPSAPECWCAELATNGFVPNIQRVTHRRGNTRGSDFLGFPQVLPQPFVDRSLGRHSGHIP